MKLKQSLLVALAFFLYLMAGRIAIFAHQNPVEMDTTSYLETALQIRDTGGIAKHIQNCLSGVYTEATQHPLYLLLISPTAERSAEFFVRAKFTSYAIGFLFVALFFAVTRALVDEKSAFLAVILLLLNATFLHMTTMVACESLLALGLLAFFYFTAKGFENPKFWVAAGVCASLSFLTKSIAILALPIFVLTVFLTQPKKIIFHLRNKYFWIFFAVFFLLAAPLFARNIKVYGTPLYSNSSAVMWLDRWHDYMRTDIHEKTPSLGSYLATHDASQILKTIGDGFWVRDVKMLVDGLKPFAFWQNPIDLKMLQGFYERSVSWQEVWAFFFVVFFILGIKDFIKKPVFTLTLVFCAIFLFFVGWYSKVFPGTPPTRLLYPMIFLLLLFASRGLINSARFIFGNFYEKIDNNFLWIPTIFFLIYGQMLSSHFDWKNNDIQKSYRFSPLLKVQLAWVQENLAADDRMLASTLFMSHIFYFKSAVKGEVVEWPEFDSMDELKSYVQAQHIRYALLELSTVAYSQRVFGEYFHVGPAIGMLPTKPLPDFFVLLPKDKRLPPLFDFYEFK